MQMAPLHRPLRLRQACRRVGGDRSRASTAIVRSMMGQYQYKMRVNRLRERGAALHEFGERVLSQGSYGDDVMALQSYLSEQGYFNSADGLSGYFGAVTREAVQNWQRDHGLPITGVFNTDCKWAYLRQQEASLQSAMSQGATAACALPVMPTAFPQSFPALTWIAPSLAQPSVLTGLAGLLALWAGVALATPRALRQNAPLLAARLGAAAAAGALGLLRMLSWLARFVIRVLAAAVRAMLEPPPLVADQPPQREAQHGAAAQLAAAQLALRQQQLAEPGDLWIGEGEGEEDEQGGYLWASGVAAAPAEPASKPKKKLSDEELQQRIAVMKGEVSPRAPMPQVYAAAVTPASQRPAPRPLLLAEKPVPSSDPITGSKYGTYYGGRQVRDKVKQYLDHGPGMGHGSGAGTASRRVQPLGYQNSSGSSSQRRPARIAPPTLREPPAVTEPVLQPAVAAAAAAAAPAPTLQPFQDVPASDSGEPPLPAAGPSTLQRLLTGTELEKTPGRRGPPVPVARPGMAPPPAAVAPQAPQGSMAPPAPRPVPVIRPQRRATIGEMLREGQAGGDYDAPIPTEPMYQGPIARGMFGIAPVPPSASAPPQPPSQQQAPSVPSGSTRVPTGSKFGPPLAEAAQGSGAPVQYNADGSVVLAAKPVQLHKPARLLSKTVGFERLAQPPAAAAWDAEGAEQYRGAADGLEPSGDVFDSYRPPRNY